MLCATAERVCFQLLNHGIADKDMPIIYVTFAFKQQGHGHDALDRGFATTESALRYAEVFSLADLLRTLSTAVLDRPILADSTAPMYSASVGWRVVDWPAVLENSIPQPSFQGIKKALEGLSGVHTAVLRTSLQSAEHGRVAVAFGHYLWSTHALSKSPKEIRVQSIRAAKAVGISFHGANHLTAREIAGGLPDVSSPHAGQPHAWRWEVQLAATSPVSGVIHDTSQLVPTLNQLFRSVPSANEIGAAVFGPELCVSDLHQSRGWEECTCMFQPDWLSTLSSRLCASPIRPDSELALAAGRLLQLQSDNVTSVDAAASDKGTVKRTAWLRTFRQLLDARWRSQHLSSTTSLPATTLRFYEQTWNRLFRHPRVQSTMLTHPFHPACCYTRLCSSKVIRFTSSTISPLPLPFFRKQTVTEVT